MTLSASRSQMIVLLMLTLGVASSATAQDDLRAAQALLEKGKFEEAIEKFDAILEEDDASYEARLGLARAWLGFGDPDSANFHAVKAESLKPDALDAVELTGVTFLGMGDAKRESGSDPTASYEEAVTSFDKCVKRAPKESRFHERLGYLYYWLSRLPESAQAYLAGAKVAPKDPGLPYLAAQSYLAAGDMDGALKAVGMALAIAADFGPYNLMRARILQQQNKTAEAASGFVKALVSTDLPEGDVRIAAGGLWGCYAEAQDWKTLSEHYEAWSKKHPDSGLALWYLGYAQLQAQDHAAALKTYAKMDKVSKGEWAEAPYYQGVCQNALGKEDKALEMFKRAAAMDYAWPNPQATPVFQMRVLMGQYFGKGEFEKAVKIGKEYVLPVVSAGKKYEVLQDIGFFYRDWGTAVERRGQKKEALKLYGESRDSYEGAVAEFANAEGATDTQKAQIQNDCGLIYHYHFDDLPTAVRHYEKALSYDPTFGDALLNYGRILTTQGEYQKAVEVLSRGPADRPDIQAALRAARQKLGQ